MTKIQQAILDVVRGHDGHLTADQVHQRVRREYPTASLSTVYRNLNTFADDGIIRRKPRSAAPDFYERNLNPHDHAQCAQCGAISDLVVPELAGFLKERVDGEIISFDLIVNHVCARCAHADQP